MVDTEVRRFGKQSSTVRAVFGLTLSPELAETSQAEAVSTGDGHWVGEDVSAEKA